MFIVSAVTAVFLVGLASAQNCFYSQEIQPGETYYVYSPNYPNNYISGTQCRWIGRSPPGYNSRLYCPDITLPESEDCRLDKLLISATGDPDLIGAETYCGSGYLTRVSRDRTISVGLQVDSNSQGGRFLCHLTAVRAVTPPDTCSCGYKKSNRIVGGTPTGINEYPMLAALYDVNAGQIKCGAVIINPSAVLTAAHCVDKDTPETLAVVVGEHNVTYYDSPATQVFRIARISKHPQFTNSNNDYDIAIVTIAGTIQFSDRVGPVCLPFRFVNTDLTGQRLTALGWGTQFFGGPVSTVPMKVDLNVISQSSCRSRIPSLTSRQICTLTPGKDSCQNDSGGPLLFTDSATGWLFSIGIISYGQSCASNSPGVGTRVATLLNWIQQTSPYPYCRK